MPRLPLSIEIPSNLPDAFIIDKNRRPSRDEGIQPYAPGSHPDNWDRYPEPKDPGNVDDGVISPDHGKINDGSEDGTVNIDDVVWQMAQALRITVDA